jgi:hypothetical protein
MVEKLVAITKDDTVCIICHESVKDMVELKRAWVGLTGLQPEPTIDGWPLYSGLPPIKVQDEREANYKSFAQSAQVIGIPEPEPVAYIDVETRNLSWAKLTRWETPTVVKMDKVPLYAAPPKKEWVGLTDDEKEDMLKGSKNAYDAIERIEAKLKEKNCG